MFAALQSLRAVPDSAFAAYPTPASLAGLPWATAHPLASLVAAQYRATPSNGLALLLVLLCARRFRPMLRLYKEATPGQIAFLMREGASKGRSPWGYARQQLWAEVRKRTTEAEAEMQSEAPSQPDPQPEELSDTLRTLESLPPDTQEILIWIANKGSAEGWAVEKEISTRTAQRHFDEAKKAFEEALQKNK